MTPVKRPENESMGEWNAYVAAGETSEIRKERLADTPRHIRGAVKNHAVTVFRMRKR